KLLDAQQFRMSRANLNWREADHAYERERESLQCFLVDLIPSFRTKLSMISSKERGKVHVEEQSHRGADDRGAQTTGSWTQGGRCGAGSGGVEAHDLCLEGEVWRDGCE